MKLVIQIPCYNEAETLPETLADLPETIPGIDIIEILVIDDGSEDNTVDVARKHGVHHIVSLPFNQGLATAFARGLREARKLGADIVVNTDADNQYPGRYIEALIEPVLNRKADLVVGCRPIENISHFSPLKKKLQRLGSQTVAWLTGSGVSDVTSGFRAYSRRAVRKLKSFSKFTYTVESIIQASRIGLRIATVDIQTNPPTRPSRLFHSNFYYIRRQASTIIRIWALYSPDKLFNGSGLISIGLGTILIIRFIIHYLLAYPDPSGKVQSLIIASIFISMGFSLLLFGVIADLIGVNRHLMESIQDRLEQHDETISTTSISSGHKDNE